MKRALLVPAFLLLVLFSVSSAIAAVPKTADPKVVVPTSLAGVKLGMPEGKALAAWGGAKRADCDVIGEVKRCFFGVANGPQGYGLIELHAHKVSAASVDAARDKNGQPLATAAKSILAIKGKNGVGIGSTYAKAKAAYPKAQLIGTPTSSLFYLDVKGKQKSSFTFTF